MRKRTKWLLALEALAAVCVLALFLREFFDRPSAEVYAPSAPTLPPAALVAPPPLPEAAVWADPTPEPTEAPRNITMAFCGDILLDSSVKRKIEAGGYGAVITDAAKRPFLDADVAFVDLELPFSNRGAAVDAKEFTFRGNPEHITLLSEMGVDIVTLANNHTLDYGQDAFLDTLDLLDGQNIKYVGGGRDKARAMAWETFDVGGRSVACLAASRVVPTVGWYATASRPGVFGTYDPTELNAQIRLAKAAADFVVVFAHWGVERADTPEAYQRQMARGYIDAGADAVVACHPHVLQGFEYYEGKPIAYSLGNFIFTDGLKETAALTVTFGDAPPAMRLTPCLITDRQTDVLTDGAKLENLRRRLNEISFDAYVDDDWNVIQK